MNEINCPKCKTAFKIDEAGFADIQKQVRDREFEQELKNRLSVAESEKNSAVELAEATIKNETNKELVIKEREISDLKAKAEIERRSDERYIEEQANYEQKLATRKAKEQETDEY